MDTLEHLVEIESLLLSRSEHHDNMMAFLTHKEIWDYYSRELNWQINIAIFNDFLDRDKEKYPMAYLS